MKRGRIIYFLLLAALFVLLVRLELGNKRLDWTLSLEGNDKRPLGCYVFRHMLDETLRGKGNQLYHGHVEDNHRSIYELFYQEREFQNIIFVAEEFAPDQYETEKLIAWAQEGKTILISAFAIRGAFADTLGFVSAENFFFFNTDSTTLRLTNPSLAPRKRYALHRANSMASVARFDTSITYVAGYQDTLVNFVRIPYGEGSILLHTQPMAFTNYNMLARDNYKYAFHVASYLMPGTTLWDDYQKPLRVMMRQTPLSVVKKHPALRNTWHVLLICIVLFMFFESKRRQRAIRVIKPLPNLSMDFTQTIARLYYKRADHRDIALKRFAYLLDFLRVKYNIRNTSFDDETCGMVAAKTGADSDTVLAVFRAAVSIEQSGAIDQDMLLRFNGLLEAFYAQCK